MVASRAAAQSGSGKAYFDSGVRHYNLGHFQEAITDFESAYNIDPAPILLFNIAQSHRQLGDKERALFFYRRYLEQAPNAANRAEVEQRMKDLTQSLQQEKDLKQQPPAGVEAREPPVTQPPSATPPPSASAPAAGSVTKVQEPVAPGAPAPRWQLDVSMGPGFVSFSGLDLEETPVTVAFRAGGSYAFLSGPSSLRVGAEARGVYLPYTKDSNPPVRGTTSSLWGLMLTARYTFLVTPDLALGAGAGLGVIWWAGLHQGNPFTVNEIAADSPIPMPSVEVGLRAEYALGPRMFLALSPELLLSKTTSDNLSNSVSSVRSLDIYAGAGYRF